MARWHPLLVATALAALALPSGECDAQWRMPAAVGARIGEVRKVHNVDLGDGRLAVQLTVPIETWGMKDRVVAVVIFFHDSFGRPVPSNGPQYADSSGQLRIVSHGVVIGKTHESGEFPLQLPYAAFPQRGGRYSVEGRVRLVEHLATGRTLLASGSVQFSVE
jgi:hypothetical protein